MKNIMFKLLLFLPLLARAEPYKLDVPHTELGFSVKHLLISNVKGRFDKFSGTLEYDKEKKLLTGLKVEIEAASINTNEKNRDDHLRSEDFFDAKKYKTITFKIEKADVALDGKISDVKGSINVKGKEFPVTLKLVINGETEIEGTKKIGFSASTEINRKDWGISWNKTLDKGGLAVSEEVKIQIEGEANLIKPKK